MEPQGTEAEVLYMDQSWKPTIVTGWIRLDVAHRQPIKERWIFWLVQLGFDDGSEGWYEYDPRALRPIQGRAG